MSALHEVNFAAQQNGDMQATDPVASISRESEYAVTSPPSVSGIQDAARAKASVSRRDVAQVRRAVEQCCGLCASTFLCEQAPVRSLGFTSALAGEGKSFVAALTAIVLATDCCRPVTLVECNWTSPSLHTEFGIPAQPGLAEWLRGECSIADIRQQVSDNLTVIPAGDGERDAVRLLAQVNQQVRARLLAQADELLVVELPPVLPTAYVSLAARFVEALVVVVRTGVTSDALIAETCTRLKGLRIQGVVLNQAESAVPGWIRQLL